VVSYSRDAERRNALILDDARFRQH
jgi:hypothetical protein